MSGRESVRVKLQDRASVFLSFVLIIPIVSLIILSAFFSKKIFYNTNSKILNGLLVELNNKEQDEFSKLNIDYFQIYGNHNSESISNIKYKFNKKKASKNNYSSIGRQS